MVSLNIHSATTHHTLSTHRQDTEEAQLKCVDICEEHEAVSKEGDIYLVILPSEY